MIGSVIVLAVCIIMVLLGLGLIGFILYELWSFEEYIAFSFVASGVALLLVLVVGLVLSKLGI